MNKIESIKKTQLRLTEWVNVFTDVLPDTAGLKGKRLARILKSEVSRNPALAECDFNTLIGAALVAAELGLDPGVSQQCHIIPFAKKATFIIGFRGLMELARRSGEVKKIHAACVFENDGWKYAEGLRPILEHRPTLDNRGKMIAAYAIAELRDGTLEFKVMSKAEIDKRKAVAKTKNIWDSWYEEMAIKTVIKNLCKYLPLSTIDNRGLSFDQTITSIPAKIENSDIVTNVIDSGVQIYEGEYSDIEQEPEAEKVSLETLEKEAEKQEEKPEFDKDKLIKEALEIYDGKMADLNRDTKIIINGYTGRFIDLEPEQMAEIMPELRSAKNG